MTTSPSIPFRRFGFLVLFGLAMMPAATASPLTGPPPLESYTTTGGIGDSTAVSVGTIGFMGVWDAPLLTPGAVSLGQFVLGPLPTGAGLTYHDMPFSITMFFSQGSGTFQPSSGLSIEGLLNGSVTSPTQSDLSAAITSVGQYGTLPLPFPLASFSVNAPQVLVPPAVNGGQTMLVAYVAAPSIPEPASWAVFGLALAAGLHWFRRTRSTQPRV